MAGASAGGGGWAAGAGGNGGSGGAYPRFDCPGAGWEAWDDFAKPCNFCAPKSKAALPPPMQWEPCSPLAGMQTGCRELKVDWPEAAPPSQVSPIGFYVTAEVTKSGAVNLAFVRLSRQDGKPYSMVTVAEADGPVHAAFLYAPSSISDYGGCAPYLGVTSAVRGGKYVLRIEGDDPSASYPDGQFPEAVVGGSIDELRPKVLRAFGKTIGPVPETAGLYWLTWDLSKLEVASWGGQPQILQSSADIGGLNIIQPQPFEDFLVWLGDGGNRYQEVWAAQPGGKPYPFLVPPNFDSDTVGGFATDGIDMAWFRGTGMKPGGDNFTVRDLVTAAFTKSPGEIKARRLRSYPDLWAPTVPLAIGCGRVAMATNNGPTYVVRLADGWAWQLPMTSCSPPSYSGDWCFERPLALTCDELFLGRTYDGANNYSLARVRFDALGSGIPPD